MRSRLSDKYTGGVEPLVSVAEGSVANSGCEPTYSRGDPACYLSHNVSECMSGPGDLIFRLLNANLTAQMLGSMDSMVSM